MNNPNRRWHSPGWLYVTRLSFLLARCLTAKSDDHHSKVEGWGTKLLCYVHA